MLRNVVLKQLILIIPFTLLLFAGALLLRLDFSSSNFLPADIISMFSPWAWIYLVLLPIAVPVISRLDKRLSWIIPFSLAIVSCVIFTLVQYPRIFYWDTFFHATTAKYIVNQGNLPVITDYFQYPGAFIFLSVVSEILGLPLLESSMLLATFLVLMITFLLLLVGRALMRRINSSLEMSWLLPTIFLAFDFSFFTTHHYSPQLVGLLMSVFFVYLCVRAISLKSREWTLLLLLSLVALTTIHVFSMATTVACVFCIYLIGKRTAQLVNRPITTFTILIAAVVLFISWESFFAEESFGSVASFLASMLRGQTLPRIGSAVLLNPLPNVYTQFLSIYRYGIYAILALASFLGLLALALGRYKIEYRLFLSIGLGVFLGALIIYFTPVVFGVGRVLHFGGVIVAILSSCAIVINRGRIRAYFFKAFTIALPFLVIATFLVSNAYYSTYLSFVHPDEMRVAEFAAENVRKRISVEVQSSLIIRFYADVYIPILRVDSRTDNSTIAQMKIGESDLNLQYLPRQLCYFNLTFVESGSSLIYSNGLGRIYAKTDSNVGS
jgi:hypothetical protein